MKRFILTVLSIAATALAPPAFSQDDKEKKIGTANMAKLVSAYHKTKAMAKTFKSYEKEVIEQRDERIKNIKIAAEKAQKFQKDAQVPTLSDENRAALFDKAARHQKEFQSLQNDLRQWLGRRQSAINERQAMELGEIRQEVLEIVRKVGDEEGYDFIFDRSGAPVGRVSVLVYTKDVTDLTGTLLERINKDAPEETPAEEKE